MRRLFFILFLLLIIGFIANIMTIRISDSHKSKGAADKESEEIFIELSDEEIEMRHWIKLRELAEEKLTEVK